METQPGPSEEGVTLMAIKFFFNDAHGQSAAIPVHVPTTPEFPPAHSTAVAYPATALGKDGQVKILCCLKTFDESKFGGKYINVRAVLADNQAVEVVPLFSFAFQHGILFSSADNVNGFIPAILNTKAIFPSEPTVDNYALDLLWQWQFPPEITHADPNLWEAIGQYKFEFFMTLDLPLHPWGRAMNSQSAFRNDFQASVGLIRHACHWAQGSKNKRDAVMKITQALIDKTRLIYNTAPAYSTYPSDPETGCPVSLDVDPYFTFNATALAERLRGIGGLGKLVNCVDLSHIVMLLGNILGCGLRIGRLENSNDRLKGFELNGVTPLRCNYVEKEVFRYHAIAYMGHCFDDNATVFDPCLSFPGPDGQPEYPIGWTLLEYRKRLAVNLDDCQPQFYTQQECIMVI